MAVDQVKKTGKKPRVGDGTPGPGRPKGVQNKSTVAMKQAIMEVYKKLQDGTKADHGHFHQWAEENPTEFYKIAAKLIPLDVNANVNGQIGMPEITLGERPSE